MPPVLITGVFTVFVMSYPEAEVPTATQSGIWPGWQMLDNNSRTKRIVVDGTNLYQLHSNGEIWQYEGTPMTGWRLLSNSENITEVIAADGELYRMSEDGLIWKYTGTPISGWELIDNSYDAFKIAVSQGKIFKLNKLGYILQHSGNLNKGWFQIKSTKSKITAIAASEGKLYAIIGSVVKEYLGAPNKWKQIDRCLGVDEIVCFKNDLYQRFKGGRIAKYNYQPVSSTSIWDTLDNHGNTNAIAVGAGGLFQSHRGGAVFQYENHEWRKLDENPMTVQIAAGAMVHQLYSNGGIYRYTG